jgi:putative transposase
MFGLCFLPTIVIHRLGFVEAQENSDRMVAVFGGGRMNVGPKSVRTQQTEVPFGNGTYVTGLRVEIPSPIEFRGFNPCTPVRIYRRHLPHWRQEGATYFVTFRLADSIPRKVLKRVQEERQSWLSNRGLTDDLPENDWIARYRAIPESERRAFERAEARKLFTELDACHGACHLRRSEVADIIAESLRFHDGQRLRCGDFVVMPNHVHWLVQPLLKYELEDILQSVKRFSATQINRLIVQSGSLWQKENYDHLVRDQVELLKIRKYIAENPAKAGISTVEGKLFQAAWVWEGQTVPFGDGTHEPKST